MLTLQFTLTDEDYYEYSFSHQLTIPEYRKANATNRYKWLAIFGSLAIVCFLISLIGGGLFFTVYTIIGFASLQSSVKRNIVHSILLMKKTGKLYPGPEIEMVFSDDLITITTDVSEEKLKYAGIERIIVGESAFYLYTAAVIALIVPFRAFTPNQEKDGFLRFVEEKTACMAMQGAEK